MRNIVVSAAVALLLLITWEMLGERLVASAVILPRPSAIARAMIEHRVEILTETGVTMVEAVAGFALAVVIAFLTATLFVHSTTAKSALYPYAIALKSTPLVALAPLLVLWFGNGLASKIVMASLVSFFPILVGSVKGLGAVEPEIMDLMRSLSATRWKIYHLVRVPASLGYVFPALKVASSLAVVGAVIGEFTGSIRGAGHLINVASYYLNSPLMFASIIVLSIASMIFFGLVALLERYFVFWQEAQ